MNIFQVVEVIKEMFKIKTLKKRFLVKITLLGILEWIGSSYKVILLSPFFAFYFFTIIVSKLGELNANFIDFAYNKLPAIRLVNKETIKKVTSELKKVYDEENKEKIM